MDSNRSCPFIVKRLPKDAEMPKSCPFSHPVPASFPEEMCTFTTMIHNTRRVLRRLPELPAEAGGAGGVRALALRVECWVHYPLGRMWRRGMGIGGKEGETLKGETRKKNSLFYNKQDSEKGEMGPH